MLGPCAKGLLQRFLSQNHQVYVLDSLSSVMCGTSRGISSCGALTGEKLGVRERLGDGPSWSLTNLTVRCDCVTRCLTWVTSDCRLIPAYIVPRCQELSSEGAQRALPWPVRAAQGMSEDAKPARQGWKPGSIIQEIKAERQARRRAAAGSASSGSPEPSRISSPQPSPRTDGPSFSASPGGPGLRSPVSRQASSEDGKKMVSSGNWCEWGMSHL